MALLRRDKETFVIVLLQVDYIAWPAISDERGPAQMLNFSIRQSNRSREKRREQRPGVWSFEADDNCVDGPWLARRRTIDEPSERPHDGYEGCHDQRSAYLTW